MFHKHLLFIFMSFFLYCVTLKENLESGDGRSLGDGQ